MPARAASPEIPTSEQIATIVLNRRLAQLEVNQILLQLKNGKTCRRVLRQVLKGSTYNDAELVPTILWTMFGWTLKSGSTEMVPACNPSIPYIGTYRDMSIRKLHAILKKRYKSHPSYKQLQRIFEGLRKLELVKNHLVKTPVEKGRWHTVSGFSIKVQNWSKVLARTQITPAVQVGRKAAPKASVLDQSVKDYHRVKLVRKARVAEVKIEAKPLIFEASPRTLPRSVLSDKGGVGSSLPGEQVVFPSEVGAIPLLEASLAQQQKELAAPAARIEQAREDNATFREGPTQYFSALPEDDQNDWTKQEPWEYLLTQMLDTRTKDGPGWRTALYEDDGALTLKPRIPDCVVVEPDQDSQLRGAWSIDRPAFIHLSPADLAVGDLVKRLTGCPLRFKDWQQLTRLAHLPSGDSRRLTLDNLILFVQAARGSCHTSSWSLCDTKDAAARELDVLTVVPELCAVDLKPYTGVIDPDGSDGDMLKTVLPFLHADRVKPKSLLSPDNAGKLLFSWDTLWPSFCKRLGNKSWQSLAQLPAFQGPNPYAAFEHLAELERAVRFSRCVVGLLSDCYGVSNELTSLCHIQNFPGGVSALSQSTRATLHYVMLRLYTKAPQIWLDLERWMGPEVFAAAMPVKDLARCRSFATASLRSRLEQLPPDYLALKPTQSF